jgi:response regulator RpfG family c-di-GMP phosphodiesterase
MTTSQVPRPRVLYVDDEEKVLLAVERHLRKDFDLTVSASPRDAIGIVKGGETFGVVVADLRMPGMDGVEFLKAMRSASPDTTRIMVTGNADLQAAKRAVNDGNIFRFLTKPCTPDQLIDAVRSGHRLHDLLVTERDLLQRTLRGAIDVLTQTLGLSNPEAFGRAARIRRYTMALVERMALGDQWKYEVAAMLSQLGAIAVPPDVTRKAYLGEALTEDESAMLRAGPEVASRLLKGIPRLEDVAEMVRLQEADFALGSETPPMGARVLRVALDYDALRLRGSSGAQALEALRETRKGRYDPDVLVAAAELTSTDETREKIGIRVAELRVGMIVAEPLQTEEGLLVVAAGCEVTPSLLERLRNWARMSKHQIREPVRVLASAQELQ